MLDVSDGLALDAARVARASGVRIALDRAGVEVAARDALAQDGPARVAPALDGAAQAGAAQAGVAQAGVTHPASLDAALHGGEDHALLVTLPAGVEPPAELAGHPVTRVGTVEPLAEGEQPGVALDGAPLEPRGWDPYRASA